MASAGATTTRRLQPPGVPMADIAARGRSNGYGRQPQQPAQVDAAQVDHRLPDGAAADPSDPHPRRLSGGLRRLPGDAQQGHDQVRRLRELRLPVRPRNLLDGGLPVLPVRHHRGDLQGDHRLRGRPLRAQHPEQGPAQVARHAAGAVGHSAGHEHARLAVAVRSVLLGLQLDPAPASASTAFRGPARPAGRVSRSSWSTSGSARRSS